MTDSKLIRPQREATPLSWLAARCGCGRRRGATCGLGAAGGLAGGMAWGRAPGAPLQRVQADVRAFSRAHAQLTLQRGCLSAPPVEKSAAAKEENDHDDDEERVCVHKSAMLAEHENWIEWQH